MHKNLSELAKQIMAGKTMSEGNDPLAGVTDHGPAIVHPLQKQGVSYSAGSPGEDNSLPKKNGESFNPDGKKIDGPAKSGSAPSSKDKTVPGSDKAGEGRNPTGTKEKAPGDENGQPGSGLSGGEKYNPTNRTQSVKEDEEEEDDIRILEAKDDDDDDDDSDDKSDDSDDKDDEDDDDDSDDKPEFLKKKKVKEAKAESNRAIKEHVDAMLSGENLTEEFKKKASTIFEAAVAERMAVIREDFEAEYAEALTEAIEMIKEEQDAKLDDYMSYVAKEWLKENEVAIETGTKVQIAEEFINGLRSLFVEHNIDIPVDKVDVVESLTDEVEDLESALNEEFAKTVELSKENSALRRAGMVIEARHGLTDVQISKLDKLVEGIDADTDEEFSNKLDTIRETYVGTKSTVGKTVTEDKDPASNEKHEELSSNDPMSRYVAAAKKQAPWRK